MRHFFRTIRGHLLLLLLVVFIPMVAVQLLIYRDRLKNRRNLELQSNLEMARAVSENFNSFFQDVCREEVAIGFALTSSPPPSLQDARRLFDAIDNIYPGLQRLSWVSPEGRILVSNEERAVGRQITGRSYYREIVDGRDWALGNLIRSEADRSPVFTIATGIRNEAGALMGIVDISFSVGDLKDLFAVKRFEGGTIAIVDRTGRIVFHYPGVQMSWEDREGRKNYSDLGKALGGEEVTDLSRDNLDGKLRFSAMSPIRSVGWVARASRLETEAMGPVYSQIYRDIAFFFFVLLASFFASLLISRRISSPIGKLKKYALTLKEGRFDRISITGAVELQELAQAFGQMAEGIRGREERLGLMAKEAQERAVELQQARDGLELKVRERTADLHKANLSLQDYARKLEAGNRDLADFAFMASHDLQEPLRKLQTFSDLIKLSCGGLLDEKRRDYLDRMARSADRIRKLISAVHHYSTLGRGSQPLKPVDLNVVVQEAMGDLEELLKETRGNIEAGDLPTLEADESLMRLLFGHLLSNALQYRNRKPAVIKIHSRKLEKGEPNAEGGTAYEISVSDNGIGFDEKFADRIFRPFERLDKYGPPEGIGMGLPICRKIAELHGGSIRAESRLGEGSTFLVILPEKSPR